MIEMLNYIRTELWLISEGPLCRADGRLKALHAYVKGQMEGLSCDLETARTIGTGSPCKIGTDDTSDVTRTPPWMGTPPIQ